MGTLGLCGLLHEYTHGLEDIVYNGYGVDTNFESGLVFRDNGILNHLQEWQLGSTTWLHGEEAFG